MKHSNINALIELNKLPETFKATIDEWYTPLANSIASEYTQNNSADRTLLLGVQGSQGSGKSTLAQFLSAIFEEQHSLRCVELSLDDFYLPRNQRLQLAETVHPLLQTRGVPGTHDIDLAITTIDRLRKQTTGQSTQVPRFNKAVDDRYPQNQWDTITGPVDIIIFEGWCVGCKAQTDSQLTLAINELEEQEDSDGYWRKYVNSALQQDYQTLFTKIDKLVVLQAPSFECVFEWRWLQEQKLIATYQRKDTEKPAQLLNQTEIRRFISHYERLTRHCIDTLPAQADWVLKLDKNHHITELISSQ
jgi:D-glycerate 3-kinase